YFFFQAEDGIRGRTVTGVQTCALPISASQSLQALAAPFVYAPFIVDGDGVYQPQLQVSWPMLDGFPVANYELYVDGAATPAATRSEERRVGKECRSRRAPDRAKRISAL